jgi:hypothetical protein
MMSMAGYYDKLRSDGWEEEAALVQVAEQYGGRGVLPDIRAKLAGRPVPTAQPATMTEEDSR